MLKQTKIHYNSQQSKAMGYVASGISAKWANDSYSLCTAQLVWAKTLSTYLPVQTVRKQPGPSVKGQTDVWGAQESQEHRSRGGMHRVEGVNPLLTLTSCCACLLTRT